MTERGSAGSADAFGGRVSSSSGSSPEACRATQNVIDVETDVGVRQFSIPSTWQQVFRSEQRDQWIEADRKALDSH